MDVRLGKKPATSDARDLKFSTYLNAAVLPPVPTTFGHDTLINYEPWGMLGNDRAGDCVWAGAAHEEMLWKSEARQSLSFTTDGVLSDYSVVTGYDPVTGANDNGTNVRDALNYRRSTGVKDAHGVRHQILAYVALEPGNFTQLWQALYLFGAVGIGINFPSSAMDQFNRGVRWSVVSGSQIEGGHYIPVVARRNGIKFVTWGTETTMTKGFYSTYCDEAWVCLSPSILVNNKSPEGFDLTTLKSDLALL